MMEHEELFPLLLKIAQGNKEAFEKLYAATSAQLYAIALENPQRQAIHLAYFNGFSHAEVVKSLDIPLGTI